nr:MAG: hypothetical protein 2 [Leviviridae sp.]
MTIAIPAAITGGAQTGLTAPVYNTVADQNPDVNSKQNAITSLGGTQAGVNVHSVSIPFTITVTKPKGLQSLGKPNPTTGLIASVPRNNYKILTRKGVLPLAGQPYQTMIIRTEIEVPAGADSADLANIRAALSAHIGMLWAQSQGIGDTAGNGILG